MTSKVPPAREVVLHIGSGKTGTSAIQHFLADRRRDLAAGGVLYPRAMGPVRHTHLGHSVKTDETLVSSLVWQRGRFTDPAAYRAHHREQLAAELAREEPERILFSDEGLYALGRRPLAALRELLDEHAAERTVLVYLRPQAEHLVSRYQQSVKVGYAERLVDFAGEDHKHLYDYARRLRAWSQALEPVRLAVRPFEPARFAAGSLLADVVAAAELPIEAPGAEPARRNESLDAEAVELLRLLNADAVRHEGARPGAIDNLALVDLLAARPRGPLLTLPDDVLAEFGERWAESNARVARRYLDVPELFAGSPANGTTTTVQHLPTARLTELLDLAGIPAERSRRVIAANAAAG